MQQRQASPHTIGSYRDSFRLLLQFAQARLGQPPSRLTFEQIDAPLIAAFLDDLEKSRGIVPGSRNLRLTAIRSFFRYASFEAPAHAAQIQRVLAIPSQRFTRAQIGFLTRPEIDALLRAPDQRTWSGRRDHAHSAGRRSMRDCASRNSPASAGTRCSLGTGAHIRMLGKGRKERCDTADQADCRRPEGVVARNPRPAMTRSCFPAPAANSLSSDGVQYLLTKHVAAACQDLPILERNDGSRLTCCATPRPWNCYRPAWTGQ